LAQRIVFLLVDDPHNSRLQPGRHFGTAQATSSSAEIS
jgi:hypothetical protein